MLFIYVHINIQHFYIKKNLNHYCQNTKKIFYYCLRGLLKSWSVSIKHCMSFSGCSTSVTLTLSHSSFILWLWHQNRQEFEITSWGHWGSNKRDPGCFWSWCICSNTSQNFFYWLRATRVPSCSGTCCPTVAPDLWFEKTWGYYFKCNYAV